MSKIGRRYLYDIDCPLYVDRSSSSYTSSVEELVGYETAPALFPLPPTASQTQVHSVTEGEEGEEEAMQRMMLMARERGVDLETLRYVTHREELNPALAPSPRGERFSSLISPDPVAAQLMLNNRRHINERNIQMMEQTFLTVNELNHSR